MFLKYKYFFYTNLPTNVGKYKTNYHMKIDFKYNIFSYFLN